jgi:hypothetical protein
MIATYLLDEKELDERFYQQFRNKRISITVAEANDETDYLLANAANAKQLLESINNSKKEGGLIKIDLEKLKEQIGE